MGAFLLLILALGVGFVVIWVLIQIITALFAMFFAMLGLIAAIFTGKLLWDFITKDDEPDDPAPIK